MGTLSWQNDLMRDSFAGDIKAVNVISRCNSSRSDPFNLYTNILHAHLRHIQVPLAALHTLLGEQNGWKEHSWTQLKMLLKLHTMIPTCIHVWENPRSSWIRPRATWLYVCITLLKTPLLMGVSHISCLNTWFRYMTFLRYWWWEIWK